ESAPYQLLACSSPARGRSGRPSSGAVEEWLSRQITKLSDRVPAARSVAPLAAVAPCKTVGSAYVGSNPTPATTCTNNPLAGNSRLCRPFPFCPGLCDLVALYTV